MRVLTVLESPSWIEEHINGSLSEMGHDVVCYRYGPYVGEFYGRARQDERQRKNRELLDEIRALKSEGLDFIFCYVSDDFLSAETAKALSQIDIPIVNYVVDSNSQWYRHTRTARFFSRILCGQRENMANLARHGAAVYYFPFAGRAPTPADEAATFTPAEPVTFVGTPIACRVQVLQEVERAGIPLAVYGKGWDNAGHSIKGPTSLEKSLCDLYHYSWTRLRGEGIAPLARSVTRRFPHLLRRSSVELSGTADLSAAAKHGFVPKGDLVSLFRRSKINIGITRLDNGSATTARQQVKVRDFEVPLAGGFYLVEDMPEHREFFEVGKEIVTWRTVGELLEKTRYYLEHELERRAIAEAGRRRALSAHTWVHRFQGLFGDLGLSQRPPSRVDGVIQKVD